jgi:hypothetical protein
MRISSENYVSSKQIISKVFRDLNLRDDNSDRWHDFVEWIGEGMEFIHIHATLCKKQVTLPVENHRALLPCDYYSDGQVLQQDVFAKQNDSFYPPGKVPYSFSIDFPYINTSYRDGELTLEYLAFPIDSEGFPLIPDNPYVREALFWYVLAKMIMGGYTHSDPTFNYLYARDQWKEYCHKAKTHYRMPQSINDMEQLKTSWLRLIPRIHEYTIGFANSVYHENLNL